MRLRASRSTRWLCSSAIGSRAELAPLARARRRRGGRDRGSAAARRAGRASPLIVVRRDLGGAAVVLRLDGEPDRRLHRRGSAASTSMIAISGAASTIAGSTASCRVDGRRRAAVAAAEQAQVHRAGVHVDVEQLDVAAVLPRGTAAPTRARARRALRASRGAGRAPASRLATSSSSTRRSSEPGSRLARRARRPARARRRRAR